MPSDAFNEWFEGRLEANLAYHAICKDLGEVTSSLEPLEREKEGLRADLSFIMTKQNQDRVVIEGFGTLEITQPGVTHGFDAKKIQALINALLEEGQTEVAARLARCKKETPRSGSIRITPEKKARK